jgi:hypothetical protein
MQRPISIAVLLAISLSALAAESIAVVTTRFSGVALERRNLHMFLPGEVVTVLELGEKQSRVDAQSGETIGGVWVPNEIFVYPRSFEKIKKWTGEREFEQSAGDYAAIYKISSNGTFRAKISNGDDPELVDYSGHLYQHKMIIWARVDGKRDGRRGTQPEGADIFVLMPNGKLCVPVPSEVCVPAP